MAINPAALPEWTGGSGIPVTVDATGSVTAHAQSLSVLFDSFTLTPPSRSGQSTTHTVAFRTVVDVAAPVHLSIRQQLRGRVVKGAESRVVLMSILGPSVLVHEFPYGQPFDDGIEIEHEDDFVQAPRQPCTGIITVLVEQRESDTPVLVAIDSLDATLAPDG
ncbi:MAG TPA: hypothetical protein VF613_13250 [Longimicrobium sp.]|jgi:hypothetical protein